MERTASSWAKPSTCPRVSRTGRKRLHLTAFWKAADAVQLKESLQAARASVLSHGSSEGVSALLQATQVRACQEERRVLGACRRCTDSNSCHCPPTLPENTPHSRKMKNVWGQSKRKMLQGRASSTGICGVSVIGGAWECLQMKETLNGEEGLVLSGKRQNGRNGLVYCLHTNSKWDGSVFPSLLLQAESKTK